MLDTELLALLVCPATHQDVVLGTEEETRSVNKAVSLGTLKNVGGTHVDQAVQGILIRQDRTIAYPVRDGIPIMLIAEGLVLQGVNPGDPQAILNHG